jgi:hypothetical protein
MEGSGAIVEILYPGYHGSPVTAQKYGYDQFPPAAHDWGIIRHIPDMTPPLLAKEETPPT